jgi:glycosyltransferase involved in cell wall biosynthesis
MACGCLPVAGDLESIREWIEDGVNGLLVDPRDPPRLAQKMALALESPELRARASDHNHRLIAERGDYAAAMARAESFYRELAGR